MATQTPSVRGIPADDITPQTFHFGDIPIRTFPGNGVTWLLAKDVCTALGISRHKLATGKLAEDQRCTVRLASEPGRKPRREAVAAVNADGLHALIQASPSPEAKRFRRWVKHKVLASMDASAKDRKPKYKTKHPPQSLIPGPAPKVLRRIRTCDDLSFTRRNAKGERIQWFVPPRANSGHEHYGIGEIWFSEVVELARHNPRHAYDAMRFAGPEMARYWNHGHPDGFFDRMARWALGAILANAQEPMLPFELPCLGFAPLEGMEAMLATAAAPRPLPDHVQEAIDRQAWQEAAECQRHYYERRRRDLMARHD
ncbi:Bro-N domain-containing protein [Delftia sp. SD018]|uniref:BRO-N domain-containing protein n=1 Tax=unclassified Delftia TaxID=2613839 RepID=UPI001A9581D0|nr:MULTISPECIES: Bro-N domain-containing protein [unclassified Delftia]MBO0990029.1 Bro-N domain-containing protein [Delftia sp. SD083]MBO1036242.1 Bro-N domain-containing protein [Delftia sp. SD018]